MCGLENTHTLESYGILEPKLLKSFLVGSLDNMQFLGQLMSGVPCNFMTFTFRNLAELENPTPLQ